MRTYTIRSAAPGLADGNPLDPAQWPDAAVTAIAEYPWYKAGSRQDTHVRLLHDSDALHVLFVASDRHISAQPRELNGPVCLDSCVEFFANPWPDDGLSYFNLEINCCGAVHFGFGPHMMQRWLATPAQAGQLTVRTTFPGPAKDEAPGDREWRVYARIPLSLLNEFCARRLSFSGRWAGNFYRCGGKTDPQYACWNPISWERPNFHRPEQFGDLVFA